MVNWSGVFPAVTTKKFAPTRILDLEATQASLARAIEAGVNGVVVLGMLGENGMMTAAEKESIVRAAKEVVAGRVPLLSGPRGEHDAGRRRLGPTLLRPRHRRSDGFSPPSPTRPIRAKRSPISRRSARLRLPWAS